MLLGANYTRDFLFLIIWLSKTRNKPIANEIIPLTINFDEIIEADDSIILII